MGGLQAPGACSVVSSTSLTKHKFKDKIIKDFKMLIESFCCGALCKGTGGTPTKPALAET